MYEDVSSYCLKVSKINKTPEFETRSTISHSGELALEEALNLPQVTRRNYERCFLTLTLPSSLVSSVLKYVVLVFGQRELWNRKRESDVHVVLN